jgi:hypothetical protein
MGRVLRRVNLLRLTKRDTRCGSAGSVVTLLICHVSPISGSRKRWGIVSLSDPVRAVSAVVIHVLVRTRASWSNRQM